MLLYLWTLEISRLEVSTASYSVRAVALLKMLLVITVDDRLHLCVCASDPVWISSSSPTWESGGYGPVMGIKC